MAAKSIQEAVKIGCKDLLADQDFLIMEIRDMAAHLVMRLELLAHKEHRTTTARELFEIIFKDYPAFKGVKK